ncbi:GroES-like protein [Xylaria grammica]|nr:GroES-like protein [Xylaria grammica]
MAPTNKAAYYPADKAPTIEVAASPYPTPEANEVIIRVSTVAINPADWKIQSLGSDVFPGLPYPYASGFDVSGTIVEAGASVSNVSIGDRVLSYASDFTSRAGGFQRYVAAPASLTARVPENTPLLDAAVLPSSVATAAIALQQYLGLAHPSVPARPRNGETVLISAGASSVGSNAIQFAVAAGYEVYTTASPHNTAHCEALGASRVFDYRSPTLAADLKAALRGKRCAGAVSSVESSNAVVFDVVAASEGSRSVACTVLLSRDGVPPGIRAEMIHGYHAKDTPLAADVYGAFLPAALASGQYRCVPKPRVVGTRLEAVQAGLDILRTGSVSCEKLVVTLAEEA